jgi:fructosamine-3-kinase
MALKGSAPLDGPSPLRSPAIIQAVTAAAAAHRGRPWRCEGFTNLSDRASHPCGIFHGTPFSVFAKLATGVDGVAQVTAEARGLALIRELSGVTTPVPVGPGMAHVDGGALLLSQALPERGAGAGLPSEHRTAEDYAAIGRALAQLHQVRGESYGLTAFDGFYGPLRQSNAPVAPDTWAGFYAERRVLPLLRHAVDSGHLPAEMAVGVERIVSRFPELCGPEPVPALLHGDAQQNNFVSIPGDAVLIDVAPYFGHPEFDLALVDYFSPVPEGLFAAYREITPIAPGFPARRELWRLAGYLAVVAVDGGAPFGRATLPRLAAALDKN